MLRSESCDAGQGFLFARPLEVEDVEGFLLECEAGVPAAATRAAVLCAERDAVVAAADPR